MFGSTAMAAASPQGGDGCGEVGTHLSRKTVAVADAVNAHDYAAGQLI
jgi:hypothetical protein